VAGFFQRERANLKGRWAPLLVLVTCCAVTLLVAQQGETIDRQRTLIQVLWGDSRELNAIKQQEFASRDIQPKPSPDEVAPAPAPPAKPPAAKPKAQKPKPPHKSPERQAIEKPGPRLLRYI
jgi:outer membrane biosynthesis protein TonB